MCALINWCWLQVRPELCIARSVPSLSVTFDLLSRLPPLSWRRPSSPVNEVEDPGGIAGTVWLEERLSVCERLLIVWRWTCSTHAGSGLCGCGGGVVECHRCPCVPFGVDQAVLYYWHCLWTSGGLPVVGRNFLENGPP